MSTEGLGLDHIEKMEEKKNKISWVKIIYKISKENPLLPILFFLGILFFSIGIIML